MAPSFFSKAGALVLGLSTLGRVLGQTTLATSTVSNTVATTTSTGATSSYSVQTTLDASIDDSALLLPNIKDPEAVDPQTVCPGYTASNVQRSAYGFNASLTLAGPACNVYGTDIQDLVLTVDYQTKSRLNVNIKPAYISAQNQSWFILDDAIVQQPQHGYPEADVSEESDLQFSWTNEPTFSFTVLRQSTGETLFSTNGTKLVYENQFIEFVTDLPENYNLYGMGEHLHSLRLGNNYTATFFASDAGNPLDYNLYGSHPFYLDTRYYETNNETGELTLLTGNASTDVEYTSSSHGVYLRNAHPLEASMNPTNLTWRALGGSIDLYFFSGNTQPEVTSQYLNAVGLPTMQQYWTLGYHQCRWGYKNWTQMQEVVDNFKNYDIPLETIWNDIDYMFQYRDFTNDPNTFAYDEGAKFLEGLHANGQHYVPIVDSAIYIPNPDNASDAYSVYDDGHNSNVFMLNPNGSEYIGAVWPGFTVFPDWQSKNATAWWTRNMKEHYDNVKWDGIWIDMSEVSSFCRGSCGSGRLSENPVHPPFSLPGEPGAVIHDFPEGFNVTNATEAAAASSASASDAANTASSTAIGSATATSSYLRTTVTPDVRNLTYPPYVINAIQGELGTHAVLGTAEHQNGDTEYDLHNTFGHRILNATYDALATIIPGKRPFIIGRSQFAGSGKFAGHWEGDNYSTFWSMAYSIPQAIVYGLFGMPMIGTDLCGFSGNTDKELCSRWMALGSFFPFMRNHNVLSAISQEPYVWEDVATATRKGLNVRYQLLPYMYTLMQRAHTSGTTVLRALAWEFPNDPTLANAWQQFLLGPAILVTPVLEPNVVTVKGVFPGLSHGEKWYDWYNHTAVTAQPFINTTLDAPLTHIPVHIRGGYAFALQEAKYTTAASRNSSWSVLVALNAQGTAKGEIYLDDGESITPNATLEVSLTVAQGTLYAASRGLYQDTNPLASVTVLGVQERPGNVTATGGVTVQDFAFDEAIGRLNVTIANATSADAGAWTRDWSLSWA